MKTKHKLTESRKIGIDPNPKPDGTRNACKHCGSGEFLMRYTETAWATVIDEEGETEPEVLLDGHNVQEYMLDHATAECESCHKPHKWIEVES